MKQKHFLIVVLILTICSSISLYAQSEFSYKSKFLSGYEKELSGETIEYYTLGSHSFDALLVRSLDSRDFIEWETEAVPADIKGNILTFAVIASLQINSDSHRFDVYLNNKKYFSFKNPTEKSLNDIRIDGLNKSKMIFTNLEYDRFEDLTGFIFFYLPKKDFDAGKPIRIRVQGESADSRAWFMVFKHNCRSSISLSSENVMLNSNGMQQQSLRVKIFHSNNSEKASIKIGDIVTKFNLNFGFNSLNAFVEKLESEKDLPIEIKIGNKTIARINYHFKPIKPVTIYLIPHSHVDIGYTNIQDDVRRIQWQHIKDAIELSEKTKNYPDGSKFKWNVEVLWALETFLDSANNDDRNKLIDAVKNGSIGIDGMYANMLTGLSSPDEWTWLIESTRRISSKLNKKITSAMISDIPGWSWSIVPALSKAGIKYLSLGINQGDRIGSVRKELGDKPFYWISPSGNDKILTWVHEQGYSAFHYIGKAGTGAGISVLEPTILNYANSLADQNYPYDIVPLRYTIGSDNGPTDKFLPDNIREWNKKYFSPKLVIATNQEFFEKFENIYGSSLPEKKGDITPYWEDGAGSSAYETAINRRSADKLNEAAYLFSQYSPMEFNYDQFYNGWRNVILYNEHTWGSWNSISEPESDFTKQQWKIKQLFALDGRKHSVELYSKIINSLSSINKSKDALEVINITQRIRTDIVYVPETIATKIKSGLNLVDENGIDITYQELSDGSIVFLAENVPAFGSRKYFLEKTNSPIKDQKISTKNNKLSNEFITIELDTLTGIIKKFNCLDINKNIFENINPGGYLYVNGRKPDEIQNAKLVSCELNENGPVLSSLKLKFDTPGCKTFSQEIILISGINRVEFKYVIDKQKIYSPEAVRIEFPFQIDGGKFHIENAFENYQPEREQINGSNKNFFTVNNCIDISNEEYGFTIASPDAPLFETGRLTNDAKAIGWLDKCTDGTNIYSFLMNNYWHTNFCATQEGISTYNYFVYPHKQFNPAELKYQGIISEQPLIAIPVNKDEPIKKSFFNYDNPDVFIVSIQPLESGNQIWFALYNASVKKTICNLNFSHNPKAIYNSDLFKNKLTEISQSLNIDGNDLRCIIIEK